MVMIKKHQENHSNHLISDKSWKIITITQISG